MLALVAVNRIFGDFPLLYIVVFTIAIMMLGLGRCARRARYRVCPTRRTTDEDAVARWTRIVKKLQRVRKLQRLFHNIGMHLQHNIAPYIRQRLSATR